MTRHAETAARLLAANGVGTECVCDDAYKARGRADPQCGWCQVGRYLAADFSAALQACERDALGRAADACRNYAHSGGVSQMRRQVAYACERRVRALADAGDRQGEK